MKASEYFMYCENCGTKLKKDSKICYNCGKEKNKTNYYIDEKSLPEKYKPISILGYIAYDIVFAIPIIGWILVFIFSFGKEENVNVRNWARSRIFSLIILIILYLIIFYK